MNTVKKIIIAFVLFSFTVAIPSLFPAGSSFGKMFLPMHLTVLLAAYMVGGPLAMVIGAVSPVLRHSIVGFPAMDVAMPMCFELAAYGLIAGELYSHSKKRGKSIVKSLVAALVAGRFIWAVTTDYMYTAAGKQFTFDMFITDAVINAIPGIIIQLIVVSLATYYLKKNGIIK